MLLFQTHILRIYNLLGHLGEWLRLQCTIKHSFVQDNELWNKVHQKEVAIEIYHMEKLKKKRKLNYRA